MAKTDFKVIDISMKITNQLPMIRITEDLVVTVNNRKSTILNIQAMAQEAENKENKDDMAFMIKGLEMLVGKDASDKIEALDLPIPEYGYGYNYIIYNKMQKVGMCKFTSKIENTSTDITDFKFQYNIKDVFTKAGLTSDSIKILGGTWQCYNADGKIINKLIGYGACIRQSSGIIRLERYYTTDGKIGAWAASEFVKGCYIYGEFLFSL